jgi:hypothetical protein
MPIPTGRKSRDVGDERTPELIERVLVALDVTAADLPWRADVSH